MSNLLHLIYEDPADKKVKSTHFITWRALTSFIWDNKLEELQVTNDDGDPMIRVRYIPPKDKFKIEYYSGFNVPASFFALFS